MPGDIITISMLGDADGNNPGGFAIIDARDFSIAGRWESEPADLQFMYDFWYQPRQNTLVSSEWGAPNTFKDGFNPADVAAGKYGRKLHFWDLEQRKQVQTLDLGDDGWIPLELRWQHDPDSDPGVRRRDAVEHGQALLPRQRLVGRRDGDRRRQRAA